MKILDVGCGMEVFLKVVMDQGAIPYGLDLSEDAVAYTQKHVSIDTLTVGDFESSALPDAPFDIITGWNVLEHVRHPKAWLQKAHALLKPGGLILIKVPNVAFSGLIARHVPLLKKLGLPTTSYLATRPPLHLYGFSTSTLKKILQASGFEVRSVERSRTRDQGLKGRVVAALANLIQFVTLGKVNLHPLIMAIGGRR